MEHIHFIGIGGTGLSAIAKVLLEQGYRVSGSDLTVSPLFEAVKSSGAAVYQGHRAENILGADLIVRSSAIPDENPEVQAAQEAGIPVLKRSEFLERIQVGKKVLAVAGSHGKTTTTSMVSWILSSLGLDPSFIVGGVVTNLGTNARAGQGSYFVIEADEYDHMFLGLNPDLALVTNVEHDHPDIFPTARSFQEAFQVFVGKLRPGGTLILCGEDPGASSLAGFLDAGQTVIRYGFAGKGWEYSIKELASIPGGGSQFALQAPESLRMNPVEISLQIPGSHNALNAAGAFAAADQLGLDREGIAQALGQFRGSERRFEVRGDFQGITLIDDYAHHPTEIRTTLEAARGVYPTRRILAVWQPHTFSRTQALWDGFRGAFAKADQLIVLDVYAAREKEPPRFSIPELVETIQGVQAIHLPGKQDAERYLLKELAPGDVLLVFSAGDAIEINQALEQALSARG